MKFSYPKNVRFKCQRCALCCGDTPKRARSILLLKSEAERIAKKTQTEIEAFAEEIEGSEPYVYRVRKTQNGKCVFLKDNSCLIYRIRPLICKFYPFQLKNLGTNRYAFTYTYECSGIGNGVELDKRFFEALFRRAADLMDNS